MMDKFKKEKEIVAYLSLFKQFHINSCCYIATNETKMSTHPEK